MVENLAPPEGSLFDPEFYPRLYTQIAADMDHPATLEQVIQNDYVTLSARLDASEVQHSTTVRNVLTSRAMAALLINEQGEFDMAALTEAEKLLSRNLYSLGPNRGSDGVRREHLLTVIQRLNVDKDMRQMIRNVTKPQGNKVADDIIRATLALNDDIPITDAHARRAALSAWLCYLRQNVGSCFATAPAIMVHDQQPHLMLKDITELLDTGRLRRIFGGVEYTVPLSSTWGAGDLRKLFFISATSAGDDLLTPGLEASLRAVGIADRAEAQNLLLETAKELLNDKPLTLASAEQLLRHLLLNRHQLTADDVRDYELRPRMLLTGGLVMHTVAGSESGKGGRCARFLSELTRASDAFKTLTDNALLRSWEFTLASFSETKANFATWNLYAGLGMRVDEPGGIGEQLYAIVQSKLDRANAKVHDLQDEYEQIFGQLKYVEGRLKAASTEQEIRWLRVEYQTKLNEFNTFEEMRNQAHQKARVYANLYSALIEIYIELFPQYFQEVYDADLHEVEIGAYDDSPAGFRLLFKHGRTNTAAWRLIRHHNEYIDALASFFMLSESQVAARPELAGLEQDLGEIITAIVGHVRSDAFLESSLYRMAAAHGTHPVANALQNMEKVQKKPWAYTSGGTMDTLVSVYFRREEKPTQQSRWMETVDELLIFLLDCVKRIPQPQLDDCLNGPRRMLLMHSPTHAFVLRPSFQGFKEGVQDNTYTYIWVRDNVVQPMLRFVENLYLDREMLTLILSELEQRLPSASRNAFREVFSSIPGKMKTTDFRRYVLQELSKRALPLRLGDEQIDAVLYQCLPMSHGYQVAERVQKLLEYLPEMTQKRLHGLMDIFRRLTPPSAGATAMPSYRLQEMAKTLLLLENRRAWTSYDATLILAKAAQREGFAMPAPLLFADTNWVTDYFGFVVSPATGKFELWRLDYTGSIGAPMSQWKQWLDGSRQDGLWAVYLKPDQYQG